MFVKKALLVGIALATPLAANALSKLFVDGELYPGSVTFIEVNSTEVKITTNAGGATPTPTATAAATPTATPTATPSPEGPCGVVTVDGTIDLNNPGGLIRIPLAQGTKSYRVLTTSDSTSFGMFSFAAVSGTETTTRIAWISECPGTPGYSETEATSSLCVATGTESTVIGWAQYAKRGECVLATNSVYYLNVRNASAADPTGSTCPSGVSCDVYRNIYK